MTGKGLTSGMAGAAPSLLDYLHVLSRRKWTFLAVFLLVPVIAVAFSLKQTPVYEATADVLLRPPSSGLSVGGIQQGNVDPARFAQTQALLARIPDIAQMALADVSDSGLTIEQFRADSGVTQSPGSDLLTFSFKSSDQKKAVALATAYARAFTRYKKNSDLKPYQDRLDEVEAQLNQLVARGDTKSTEYKSLVESEQELKTYVAFPADSAEVVRVPDQAFQIEPRTKRNGGIAVVLGLILGLGAAFVAEALDTRIRSTSTVRDVLGIPVLGQLASPPKHLAKQGKLVMLAAPTSAEAEAFRTLRANLAFANAHHRARVLMVTSGVDEEGKSTTAANLAVALARGGRSVVLIDADLRSPRLHQLFDLPEKPGLTDLELGDAKLEDALREIDILDTNERGGRGGKLQLISAGDALHDPDELGAEAAVARVVRDVEARADFVLVDAAPLLRVGDAVALSAHVDGLLVVVRMQSLRSATLDELERTLASTPTPKLGVIVTGAPPTSGVPYRRYGGPPDSQVHQMPPRPNGDEAKGGGEVKNRDAPKDESSSVRQRLRSWT
jgi:tyrosine-protein kinase